MTDMWSLIVEEVRPFGSALCDAELYAANLLCGATDVVRRSERTDEKYG